MVILINIYTAIVSEVPLLKQNYRIFSKHTNSIFTPNHKTFQKMPVSVTMFRVFIFLLHRLINVLYIPVFVYRIFQKRQKVPEVKDEILLIPAMKLREKIINKEVTCEEVIKRYIIRIKEVNPIINAIISERFCDAVTDAKNIDQLIASKDKQYLRTMYPLLGIPITIKGSLALKGLAHTSGMLKRTHVSIKDAEAVRLAKQAGAIPLLTSNVPELCLNWESTNKLRGTTRNPYDSTRTSGGSSGGEASLMGAGASLIGLGSDIAGSLRLPPHFCGTYGHKPTPGVVSYAGHFPSCGKIEEWTAFFTVGPMARYVSDLRLLLKVISKEEFKQQLRLDEKVDINNVKVYYMEGFDSLLTSNVSRDTKKAFQKVVKHLDKVCFEPTKKVELPLMKYGTELGYLLLLNIDEVDNIFEGKGDGSINELLKYIVGKSDAVLGTICYGLLRKAHSYLPKTFSVRVEEQIELLRKDFLELLGDDSVFIFPAFPGQAHKHGDVYRKVFDGSFLSIFNALGFPVTCGPVGFSKDKLPIGVQIVASPKCDRLCLAVTEELEKAFGGWRSP